MEYIAPSASLPSTLSSDRHPTAASSHLARLSIPYSASLPSLRKQAHEHHMQTAGQAASPTSSTRGPTPADLQSHLYQSFLSRKTADVALRIRGSWHAVYKLHRVILIQAVSRGLVHSYHAPVQR